MANTRAQKRRRDSDSSAQEPAAKRKPFLFSTTRNRSAILAATPRAPSPETPAPRVFSSTYYDNMPEPTRSAQPSTQGRQTQPARTASTANPARPAIPTTPRTEPAPRRGFFGSVRRALGFFAGIPAPDDGHEDKAQAASSPESSGRAAPDSPAPDTSRSGPTSASRALVPHPSVEDDDDDDSDPGSPTPAPHTPTPSTASVPGYLNREARKRRRYENTALGREQAAKDREEEQRQEAERERYPPNQNTPGTQEPFVKRKLPTVNGMLPSKRGGGYGIDFKYLESEHYVEGIDPPEREASSVAVDSVSGSESESHNMFALTPQQPGLRSAMRPTFGSTSRSARSVKFDTTSSHKFVYGNYGPAGDYRGSTFLAPGELPSPNPSVEDSNASVPDTLYGTRAFMSQETLKNTKDNLAPSTDKLDHTVRDPNNPDWRPSAANPRPGSFYVPFDDEWDDEDVSPSLLAEAEMNHRATMAAAQQQEQIPTEPPSTPRMAHAELPSPSSPTGPTGASIANLDHAAGHETQESQLEAARNNANKYKPRNSSRLAMSESAPEPSPPASERDITFNESSIQEQSTPRRLGSSRDALDNTVVGEDGMTDHDREHQYDDWARTILWPEPQTYAEAGICSDYITKLVNDNWTERDTMESRTFWEREFYEGEQAAQEAKARGLELEWVIA